MKQHVLVGLVALFTSVGGSLRVPEVAAAGSEPDFQEVYQLLRTNLPGIDEVGLNRAAVNGLLSQFGSRVGLLADGKSPSAESKGKAEVAVIQDHLLYAKLSSIDGVAEELASQLRGLSSSNQITGGILDLRFSQGRDFASAVAVASVLLASNQAVLDWGTGVKSATGTPALDRVPWAILVNSATSGSPEALAAALRLAETGLLVGSKTAGHAATSREFALKTGGRLSIANQPVRTADGREIPTSGLVPDIAVVVDLEAERAWHRDAPHPLNRTESGGKPGVSGSIKPTASRRRVNEADLVRMQKEGKRLDADTVPSADPREATPEVPQVLDPALSRAVDLLKGLAIVRKGRRG